MSTPNTIDNKTNLFWLNPFQSQIFSHIYVKWTVNMHLFCSVFLSHYFVRTNISTHQHSLSVCLFPFLFFCSPAHSHAYLHTHIQTNVEWISHCHIQTNSLPLSFQFSIYFFLVASTVEQLFLVFCNYIPRWYSALIATKITIVRLILNLFLFSSLLHLLSPSILLSLLVFDICTRERI